MTARENALPPGDYGYIMEGGTLCPLRVIGRRGWIWTRVLRFKVFRGMEAKRVRTRDIIDVEQSRRSHLEAFKADPTAVLSMKGVKAYAKSNGWSINSGFRSREKQRALHRFEQQRPLEPSPSPVDFPSSNAA